MTAFMFMESEFRNFLLERGLKSEDIEIAVNIVREFLTYLRENNVKFESASLDLLKKYISLLIEKGRNSRDNLVAIARYCHLRRKNDYYIYFSSILGARNVLPDIGERLATIAGYETRNMVFQGFELPPLGSDPESYPRLTQLIINRLESELPRETCREILTWNYHRLPAEAFMEKKERFEKSNSIDEYLEGEHRRLIEELEDCKKKGRIWYEQEITPEVLEFVKRNQEICTGLRSGDNIYVTKMPFAPKHYLIEKSQVLKRYYACHCPLARSTILDTKTKIPHIFCYCSAGFEKFGFDIIFCESVEVELLESALKGDMRCRFAIKIPREKMK